MIRLMRHADLPAVAQLESQLFTSASWSLAALTRELDGPDRTYYVWTGRPPRRSQLDAEEAADRILGYGGVWHGSSDAEVMTIGVAPEAQRCGIGRALLTELAAAASNSGSARLLLEVRVDNEPAKSLYRSFGFVPMGLRKHYYQPEDVDALTMSLDLARR